MLAFIAASFFLVITPGPGVLTTAGVGAGYGFRRGVPYLLGIVTGSLVVALAVASGLATLMLGLPLLREALLAASILYLLWIAFKVASAGARIAFIESKRAPGLGEGLLLSLLNPKAYAVMTSLYSGFPFYPESLAVEVAIKLPLFACITLPIHFAWLWAGASLHRLALTARQTRLINYAMAASMLAAVALAALV